MRPSEEQNQLQFDRPTAEQVYAEEKGLRPAEERVIGQLEGGIGSMRVLDIGVGTGRTTEALGPKSKEYVGIDYSPRMIEHCRAEFQSSFPALVFETMDARDLSRFSDRSFDLVVFSFNGIDCVPSEDRVQVLREIRRVLSPKGHFFFSAHNLNTDLRRRHCIRLSSNPVKTLKSIKRWLLFRLKNPGYRLQRRDESAELCDGAFGFKLKLLYIKPMPQVRQLEDAGFHSVQVFCQKEGNEIPAAEFEDANDLWLHYLCRG